MEWKEYGSAWSTNIAISILKTKLNSVALNINSKGQSIPSFC
jgi:hypothetical protein